MSDKNEYVQNIGSSRFYLCLDCMKRFKTKIHKRRNPEHIFVDLGIEVILVT